MLIPLTQSELETRERLRAHIHMLATTIGGRDATHPAALEGSARYIEGELRSWGYKPERQPFSLSAHDAARSSAPPPHRQEFENIEAAKYGISTADQIVVIGAHYDTAGGLPGANDNGSGVAATLELARAFAKRPLARTVRWLFFTNEEPPFFQTPAMGSFVYAKRCRERNENISAMLSLETIGYYSDQPGSQRYPIGFHPGYPDRGDFLGFVSNIGSASLLRACLKSFRTATSLPAVGAAAPEIIPGVGWSDHWCFWHFGYKALMLTDTAPYRYPYYHTAEDTPEKIDYDRLTRAVTGIAAIVDHVAGQ